MRAVTYTARDYATLTRFILLFQLLLILTIAREIGLSHILKFIRVLTYSL